MRHWTKLADQGRLLTGLDKRLLNISLLDGGYGFMVKGKIPKRANLSYKVNENVRY